MKKRKQNNFITILLFLLLFGGLSLLLYPSVSDYWNSFHQTQAITQYAEQVADMDEEKYNEIKQKVFSYNQSLWKKDNIYLLTEEEEKEYEELLNVSGLGVMGYIEIPEINCSLPIYHGTEESVLQVAVGHLQWSSLPGGGESTHCVLSGHRGLPSAKLFTNLDNLVEGDVFMLRILDDVLTYEVDQILIVEPQETEALQIVEGKDYCTLVTCTPYGINTHRLLVRGHRIDTVEEETVVRVVADAVQIDPLLAAPVVALPILLVLLVVLLLPKKSGKNREVSCMKRYKYWKSVILLLVFVLLCPIDSFAQGSIDLEKKVGLTISYQDESRSIAGASFDMYLVATADESGTLTTTKEFAQFNVNITGNNDEQWNILQSTLEGYVLRDNIVPIDSQNTDKEGMAYFPTGQKTLPAGLYLVLGERHTQDGTYYDASPFMVMLPMGNQESNTWDYQITVYAKYEKKEIPEEKEVVTRKVLKVWNDEGHEQERPEEIEVQLLRDGKVFETILLNADNQWRYTWENLDDTYAWKVVEKDSKGYQATIAKEGITFVITNTYTGNQPAIPSSGTDSKLPQTGQVWWPIPVCLCIGLAFIIIGLTYKEKKDEK